VYITYPAMKKVRQSRRVEAASRHSLPLAVGVLPPLQKQRARDCEIAPCDSASRLAHFL
jgi:hypothetical protein